MIEESDFSKILKRLWAHTEIVDGHWLCDYPYGNKIGHRKIGINGQNYYVHRVSAILHLGLGEFSPLLALHKLECKFLNCWNPDHLYIGTKSDNAYDSVDARTNGLLSEYRYR